MKPSYSWKKIATLSVLSLHALFLVILIINPSLPVNSKDKKPLIVKTITPKMKEPYKANVKKAPIAKTPLPAQKEKTNPATTAAAPPKPANPSSARPRAKAPEPKSSPSKKEPAIADKVLSNKKPVEKKASARSDISDSLLRELEESLEKFDKPSLNPSSPLKLPALSLQIDTPSSEIESLGIPLYVERLVSHLQNHLTLPDFGEVKIQLDLREDGSVDKIVVLSSKSKANKLYLEENLPQLRFPPPEKIEANGKCRFVFTFVNEV